MKKRGISAVVATILIILIVVVGVGIVWKVILPLFAELEYLSYSDVELNIVRQGFTVYDEDQNFAFVQIERGEDEVNMTGIEIGFNFNGTTKTYQSSNVLTSNGKYTYKFNFTNDTDMGIPQNVTPNKVTVAPIFRINNKVKLGKILDSEDMPVGRIRLSATEWEKANKEAATPIVVTTGSGDGEEPGEEVVPDDDPDWIELTECGVLDIEGGNYLLMNDVSHNETCFDIIADDVALDLGGNNVSYFKYDDGFVLICGMAIPCPPRNVPRGVHANLSNNAKITNGIVSGFEWGVNFDHSSGGSLSDVLVEAGNWAIYSYLSDNLLISDVETTGSYDGIRLVNTSESIIEDSSTAGIYGYHLLDSNNNHLRNLFSSAGFYKLKLESSVENLIEDLPFSVELYHLSHRNELRRILGSVTINANSNNNSVYDSGNPAGGSRIKITYSDYNYIENFTATHNTGYMVSGIYLVRSDYNNLTNINSSYNYYGLDNPYASPGNTLTNSALCYSTSKDIYRCGSIKGSSNFLNTKASSSYDCGWDEGVDYELCP